MRARDIAFTARVFRFACSATVALLFLSFGASAEEWPVGAPPIRMAIGPRCPPVFDIDEKGRPTGFIVDYLTEAARRAQVPIDFTVVSDRRAFENLDHAQYPLAIWLLADESFPGYVRFERGFLTLHSMIFRRLDPNAKGELLATDLGEVIAVRGSEAHQDLLDDGAISVFTVPTVDDAVLLLSSGQHDTLFGTDYYVMAAIQKLGIKNIEPAPSSEMHMHHRLALLRAETRPDVEALVSPALRAMRHDGTFDTLYDKWFGPYEERDIPLRVVGFTITSVVLGGIALGFMVVVLSRRKLRRLLNWQDEALRESELRLGELLGDVEAIVWEATPDGRFTYVSAYAETIIGYPAARWFEPDFFPQVFLHPEDSARIVDFCRVATEHGDDHQMDYRAVTAAGEVLWLHDVVHVVRDASGAATRLRGVMVDITKRKQAEEAVHASETQLAAIMSASPTGIFRLDLEGRVTFGNQEASRITGITSGPIDLKRWFHAIHPEDRAAIASAWQVVQEAPSSDHREYRFLRPDGQIVWVLDRAHPERDVTGRVVGFVGTLTDITQIKRNEEAIRTHSTVLMSMTEGVNTTDENGVILYTNEAFDEMFGYGPGELAGKHISMLNHIPDEEYERHRAAIRAGLAQDGSWIGEFRNRRKDGTEFWTRARISRLEGAGTAYGVCVQEDITEARRAREALRESEEKFRRVAESALVGIALSDHGEFTFSNEAMVRLVGYTPEELNGLDRVEVAKLFLGVDADTFVMGALERLDIAHGSTEPVTFDDVHIRHKDGTDRWATITVSRLFPDKPFPRLFVCVDSSERKRAEQTIQMHSKVLMSMAEGVAFTDETGIIIDTNPQFEAMFGYERGELVNKHASMLSDYSKEELDHVVREIRADIAAKGVWVGTFRDVKKDGTRIWSRARITPVEIGGRRGVVSVQEDITESLRAEAALKESEEKFRHVAENALVGIAIFDGMKLTFVNNAMMGAFGQTDPAWFADIDRGGLVQLMYNDTERNRLLGALRQLDEQSDQIAYVALDDVCARYADGSPRWANVMISRLFPDRQYPRVILCVDTTQRKIAEQVLRQNQDMLRRTQQIARIGGWELDTATQSMTCSDEVRRIYGIGPEVPLNWDLLLSHFHPEDQPWIHERGANSVLERSPFTFEAELVNALGNRLWVHVSAEPIVENDMVVRMAGSVQDISDLKRVEDSLRESEALFRAFSEQMPDSLLLLDLDDREVPGRILYANAAAARMHGMTLEEIVGLPISTLDHPDTAQHVPARIERMRAGETIYFEGQHRRKDGSVFPVDVVARCISGLGGNKVLAIDRDITERRKSEDALRRSEARLSLIFNTTSDFQVLFRVEPRNRFVIEAVNSAYAEYVAELVPGGENDMVGRERVEYLSALGLPREIATSELPMYLEVVKHCRSVSYEIPFFAQGAQRSLDVRIEPVLNSVEECTHVLWNARDITQRKIAEEEHRAIELKVQQAQKLESLAVLTGGIAHDFNNLLAGILGHADLMREEVAPGTPTHDSVSQIEVAARRAADLVHQMLAYAGRASFVVRSVRLSEMVRELAKLLEVTLSKKASLRYELDDSIPPIAADAAQIQQVVMNLITNASDALGDQSGVITLRSGTVEYTKDALRAYAPHEPPNPGLFVYFEVTDTGCGMDAETLARIFDPFFTTKFTGRGLGLAAALGIIRGHHGGLRVTSRLGAGTTFRIILPVAPAQPETNGHATPSDVPPVHGRAGTILVVDDEPRVRDFLVRALQRFGHEVLSAADGRQALETFNRNTDRIDAVLLDITMPEMGGEEVLARLHAQQPELPVLLMSGFSEAETRGRLSHNGYAGFLQKPFSIDALRQSVDAILALK